MSRLVAKFHYRREGGFTLEAAIDVDDALLVVVGPSGAGKSTLLRVLAGLERPVVGATISLDGENFAHLPAQRRPFGYLAQSPALFLQNDVWKNVLFGARRVPITERVEAAKWAISLCGLRALMNRRVVSLSGGERQRVAFARALASRPRVLLLDEPFSALDPSSRWHLCDFVRDLQRRTKLPCVHVTHDAAEALYLGDALSIVSDGRLQVGVPVASFLANPTSEPELLANLLPDGGRHVEPLARLWRDTHSRM